MVEPMDFTEYRQEIEIFLTKILPAPAAGDDLASAMRYSTLDAGKRLRPCLVYATAELLGVARSQVHAAAAAVELIHCYSLIHDDLPAMDDDDLRRGRPSCHKAFSEATAILAGDALQALAFAVLADPELNPINSEQRILQVKILANAAGANGMVLGQALDLEAEGKGKQLKLDHLQRIHQHKTGALFNACVMLALQASNRRDDLKLTQQLFNYSANLGLLFQIQDDILDVVGDLHTLGKPIGSDQNSNKTTYPSLLGLEQAQQQAVSTLTAALDALADFGTRAMQLQNIANFAFSRNA